MPEDGLRSGVGGLAPVTAARYGGASVALLLAGIAAWDASEGDGGVVGLTGVLVGLVVVLVAIPLVPWQRLPRGASLVWPAVVLLAIFVTSLHDPNAAQLYTAFIALSFLFVGVTQPPRTAYLLVLPAAITWWWTVVEGGGLTAPAGLVRMAFVVLVWVLVAEVPARLLQRVHRMQMQLAIRARTDALTGLNNRHDLPRALAATLPGDSVVLVDLDHFKRYNDRFGHQAGDVVLAEFGAFLGRAVRASDLAFRYGGEEFLLMLSQTAASDAQRLVDRAARTWAAEGGRERAADGGTLTFSAGIADVDHPGDDTVLSRADDALYDAKAAGRATSRVHQQA